MKDLYFDDKTAKKFKEVIILNVKIVMNYVAQQKVEIEMGHRVARGRSEVAVLFLSSIKVLFLPLDGGCKDVHFIIVYLTFDCLVWLSGPAFYFIIKRTI